MDNVALAALAATVLSALQLMPQLARSMRLSSTVGLSMTWAALGVLLNVGWVAYRSSQQLWVSVASPVIAAVLYLALLALVMRTDAMRLSFYLVLGAAASSIGLAGLAGGWSLVGTTLGLWGGVQVAPAVWSAFRTGPILAIAPTLWIVGLAQGTLWGYFGYAKADTAFVLYGVAMGTGSLAILLRYAALNRIFLGGRLRRSGLRVTRAVQQVATAALRR